MTEIIPKPEYIDLPEDKQWEEMTADQRYYYRNRKEITKQKRKREEKIREWFLSYKQETGCSECDESHPACIDFHHKNTNDKEKSVANMAHEGYSKENILKEVKKCKPLCANCHRKHHFRE